MPRITESEVEAIVLACSSNAGAIAESLNQTFDLQGQVTVGESHPWSPERLTSDFDGPGVGVVFSVGAQLVACLIPVALPIPAWYLAPNDSQQSRLQTLAMEWSMSMLPPDLEADSFRTVPVDNLRQELLRGSPAEWGAVIEIVVTRSAGGAVPLRLVLPLETPAFVPGSGAAAANAAPNVAPEHALFNSAAAAHSAPALADQARARRLLKLPVRVSVRLAEKRIELGQLMSIAPGALLTFNKSCEESLDLYVNNFRYCRGEAVKIGENFGLKIDEVGVEDVRATKVLF